MQHRINATGTVKPVLDVLTGAHIPLVELTIDRVTQVCEVQLAALAGQIVQDGDIPTLLGKIDRGVAPDEPRSTSDQHPPRHGSLRVQAAPQG